MESMQTIRFLGAFVLLVLVVAVVSNGEEPKRDVSALTKHNQKVVDKVEAIISGQNPSEQLTLKDLFWASEEKQVWMYMVVKEIKTNHPLIHLVANLVSGLESLIRKDSKADGNQEEALKAFINCYKTLRQLYVDNTGGSLDVNSPVIDAVKESISDYPGAVQLTSDLIRQANDEYAEILNIFLQISTDPSIYQEPGKLQAFVEFLNRDDVRALVKSVFPVFEHMKSEYELPGLKKIFADEMSSMGYFRYEGKWLKF